jgi:hypothetical protein
MELEQLITILGKKKIKITKHNNEVKHDWRDIPNIALEDYDTIVKDNNTYKFCKVRGERRDTPEVTVVRNFLSEDEAYNFFFLNRLYSFYMDKYVIPSRDYSIKHWNIDNIIETMKINSIPLHYLSYNKINNPNSIYYYIEKNEWFSGYVGKSCDIIAKYSQGTKIEEKDWFLSLCLNSIYPLYLLDIEEKELLTKKEITEPFSDEERARFIGYNI